MAFDFPRMNSGQISMEFILLIIVMLLYLQTIIQPLADSSINAVEDVTRLSQVKLAAEKLANVSDYISAQSNESKYTTLLIIPSDANISCASAGIITYNVVMRERSTNTGCLSFGAGSICSQDISILDSNVSCGIPVISGPNKYLVSVVKNDQGAVAIAPA